MSKTENPGGVPKKPRSAGDRGRGVRRDADQQQGTQGRRGRRLVEGALPTAAEPAKTLVIGDDTDVSPDTATEVVSAQRGPQEAWRQYDEGGVLGHFLDTEPPTDRVTPDALVPEDDLTPEPATEIVSPEATSEQGPMIKPPTAPKPFQEQPIFEGSTEHGIRIATYPLIPQPNAVRDMGPSRQPNRPSVEATSQTPPPEYRPEQRRLVERVIPLEALDRMLASAHRALAERRQNWTPAQNKLFQRMPAYLLAALAGGFLIGVAQDEHNRPVVNQDTVEQGPGSSVQDDQPKMTTVRAEPQATVASPVATTPEPAASASPKVEQHTRLIGTQIHAGEGISQAMVRSGLSFDNMMRALQLPITIGDKTGTLGQAFVDAAPDQLSMRFNTGEDGRVLSVQFYDTGNNQSLSAQDLVSYLSFTDWRAQQGHQSAVVESTPHKIERQPQSTVFDASLLNLDGYTGPGVTPESSATPDSDNARPTSWLPSDLRMLSSDTPDPYGKKIVDAPVAPEPVRVPPAPVNLDTQPKPSKDGSLPSEAATMPTASRLFAEAPTVPTAVRVQAEAPTDVVGLRERAAVESEAPTAPVEQRAETASLEYNAQLELLQDWLDSSDGRTVNVNSLEFRRSGLRNPEYQVRFDERGDWHTLTPELMKGLQREAGLNFARPDLMNPLTVVEFLSLLPDTDEEKINTIRAVEYQIRTAERLSLNASEARKAYTLLTGEAFQAGDTQGIADTQ